MQAVVEEFRAASIETGLVEYHEARWKKAVWNMPFNGMTVALHTQTDHLLQHPATRQLIREQMKARPAASCTSGNMVCTSASTPMPF